MTNYYIKETTRMSSSTDPVAEKCQDAAESSTISRALLDFGVRVLRNPLPLTAHLLQPTPRIRGTLMTVPPINHGLSTWALNQWVCGSPPEMNTLALFAYSFKIALAYAVLS